MGYFGFHEIGHALNRNANKFAKHLQNLRLPCQALAILITMIALSTNKTPDNGQQTPMQKTKNFIKENIGKLTALSFIPIITEEAIATIKSDKIIRNILSTKELKKVRKLNTIALSTYVGSAIFSGVSANIGNRVRDYIFDRTNNKSLKHKVKKQNDWR